MRIVIIPVLERDIQLRMREAVLHRYNQVPEEPGSILTNRSYITRLSYACGKIGWT